MKLVIYLRISINAYEVFDKITTLSKAVEDSLALKKFKPQGLFFYGDIQFDKLHAYDVLKDTSIMDNLIHKFSYDASELSFLGCFSNNETLQYDIPLYLTGDDVYTLLDAMG
jgi:hypothetical protein